MADIESTVVFESKYKDNNVSQQLEKLGSIINGLSNQIERFDNTVLGFSKDFTTTAGRVNNASQSLAQGYSKLASSANKEVVELEQTRNAIDRVGAQANRFVSSNIMAQFQDVFVSAQMGMKPFTVALQQGTQLMAAFAQSKAPLADLVAGFKALVGPVAILTVGLVGLATAGIQMVDWVSIGKTALNGLAAGFEFVADNAENFQLSILALGTAVIIFNRTAILASIDNLLMLGKTFILTAAKAASAWLVASGPIGLIAGAILIFRSDIIELGNIIKKVFDSLPKNVQNALKSTKDYIYNFVNETIGMIMAMAYGVGSIFDTITRLGSAGLMQLFTQEEGLISKVWEDIKGEFSEIYHYDYIKDVKSIGEGAMEGVKTGASAVADKFREWSDGLGKAKKKSKKIHDYWADIVRNANQSIASKQLEISLLGKPEFQQTYEKTLQSLMQQAEDKGIDLDPDKINQLEQLATQTARVTEETNKLTEAYKESKSIFKGFFSDMRQGLLDGESAWVSFGNAVLNVLNKIQEKLFDKTTDLLFDALWNIGSAYFGSTTGKVESSAFQGGSSSAAQTASFNSRMASLGYANGGVFSNGIYDSPTLFKFARGGRFGVMGEAGPEAVMPLRRGPDGSLGVRADGIGGSPVIVNVINNSNAQARTQQRQTSQGTEIDVMIDELVAEKMGKNGTSSNSALRAFNNQSLVTR